MLGFRSKEDLIFQDRFEALGDTIITTDDGSVGIHGRVAAGLEGAGPDSNYDQIYLCGPEMMMWDIISRTQEHAGKTQACINRYFKCAAGICGSCCLDPDRHARLRGRAGDHGRSTAGERVWQIPAGPDRWQRALQRYEIGGYSAKSSED